jgi:hypothetical protein
MNKKDEREEAEEAVTRSGLAMRDGKEKRGAMGWALGG